MEEQRSIRRTDLEADKDSPSPSPPPELLAKLRSIHKLEFVDAENELTTKETQDNDDDLAFNLFAPLAQSNEKNEHKIRLRSPTPDSKEPGFVQPERPLDYYLITSTLSHKQALSQTAISGQQILQIAQSRWHGMSYPWKAIHISSTGLSRQVKSHLAGSWPKLITDETSKRKRLGKKSRIKLRMRIAAANKQKAEAKLVLESKEAEYQEKKTRKNREKKVKQKLRNKAKKAAANQPDADPTQPSSGEDEDG